MKPIIFLPEAEQEMLEAAQYYQEQASGLGLDFLLEVERAVHSIAQSPHTWPVLEGELRRRLIRRFPCGILYRVDPEAVVIVAVAHLRKQPGYWRKRIKPG
jgi:plasmid stabilization system protein ParE